MGYRQAHTPDWGVYLAFLPRATHQETKKETPEGGPPPQEMRMRASFVGRNGDVLLTVTILDMSITPDELRMTVRRIPGVNEPEHKLYYVRDVSIDENVWSLRNDGPGWAYLQFRVLQIRGPNVTS
jgi:hypothetical protein